MAEGVVASSSPLSSGEAVVGLGRRHRSSEGMEEESGGRRRRRGGRGGIVGLDGGGGGRRWRVSISARQ